MLRAKRRKSRTLVGVDVLIVLALLRLGARGVDRSIRESLALLETCGDLDSVNGAGLLVLVPGGAGDVAADDSLDGENAELADLHAAVLEHGAQGFGDLRRQVEGDEVRAQRGDGFLQSVEPGASAEGEQNSLVGDSLLEKALSVISLGGFSGLNWAVELEEERVHSP